MLTRRVVWVCLVAIDAGVYEGSVIVGGCVLCALMLADEWVETLAPKSGRGQ